MNVTVKNIPFKIHTANIDRMEFLRDSIEYLQDLEDKEKVKRAIKEDAGMSIDLHEYMKLHNV